MKQLYPLLLFLLPLSLLANHTIPWRGYIVSKNDVPLSGYIASVEHSGKTSKVTFINDFGTLYEVPAQLIKGFAYRSGDNMVYFETKRVGNRWRFLQIVAKNQPMELYQLNAETRLYTYESMLSLPQDPSDSTIAYWLKPEGQRLFKVNRWGFRKKMRRLLSPKAPELADKIGQKGYRFSNVPKIIREYNQLLAPKPKSI
jgi:hypothetical protein